MKQMIAPEEARGLVLENTRVLASQTIAHADALRRVLARDIISEIELPPFDNSAMDGYALLASDTRGASRDRPSTLRLLETIAAGEIGTQKVEAGSCIKIMTGAKIPEGANAVVMREETHEQNGNVEIFEEAKPQQNIRLRGDDIKVGERVLEAGTLIGPAQWAMLASLGESRVEVFQKPRVGIITTGKELIDVETELQAGQIRDSNSFALRGLCESVGAQIVSTRVGDELVELRAALREYSACDCIITSGGVSVGDFDPVRDVLLEMRQSGAAQIHFWKIAMKPGKPVMFATMKNAALKNNVPFFGLPGNPVSVMVAWEEFVRPALLKMQGRARTSRLVVEAEVLAPLKSPSGKTEFVRAFVALENGKWRAQISGAQGSGRLSTMTRSNALLVIPPETTRVEAGEVLSAHLLEAGDW